MYPKSLRFVIPVVVLEVLVLLGSVIPSQLHDALTVHDRVSLERGAPLAFTSFPGAAIPQKVEIEFIFRKLEAVEEAHPEDGAVEAQRHFRVFDADHSMVEAVSIRRGFGGLRVAARPCDYLHPVVVWVEGKGDVILSAV